MSEVMERIKSLSAEEPPALDVQAIADAVTEKVIATLSAAPEAEPLPESDAEPEADAVTTAMPSEKPTAAAPDLPEILVRPQAVLLPASPILLDAEVVSLLRASLKAGLTDVTCHVLSVMLKD